MGCMPFISALKRQKQRNFLGQCGLHSEFQNSQSYKTLSQNKSNQTTTTMQIMSKVFKPFTCNVIAYIFIAFYIISVF